MESGTPPFTVIFVGRQGAGKGTQARLLERYYTNERRESTIFFDTGSELRDMSNEDSLAAELVSQEIDSGRLAPDFLPGTLLFNMLAEELTGDEHLIVDSFPRTLAQAKWAEDLLAFFNRERVHVVKVDIGVDVALERLLGRGRRDDTRESIKRRFDWYEQMTVPVIEFFKDHDRYCLHEVSGSDPIEVVQKNIISHLEGNN